MAVVHFLKAQLHCTIHLLFKGEWRNWYTRTTQNRVPYGLWVQVPPRPPLFKLDHFDSKLLNIVRKLKTKMTETAYAEQSATAPNKYEDHESSVDFLAKLAASEFGVELGAVTVSNWRQALRTIYEVDNIFDADDPNIKQLAMEELRFIFDGAAQPAGKALSDEARTESFRLKDQISDEQAHNFVTKGLQVISIGQTMRGVESPRELARLTMLEGQMTTTMLLHLVSPEDRAQPGYNDFIRFMRVGSRSGNVLDSILDLKTDHHAGITPIEPSLSNRLLMTWESMPTFLKTVKLLGVLAILKKMPSAAWGIAKDRKRTPDS